jgi:hypothetical protein
MVMSRSLLKVCSGGARHGAIKDAEDVQAAMCQGDRGFWPGFAELRGRSFARVPWLTTAETSALRAVGPWGDHPAN